MSRGAAQRASLVGDQAGVRAPRRILVAEDDDGVRVGMVANLELEGYQVIEARDGAEAVALLLAESFDLVLSDMIMPQASGAEVLRAARSAGLRTPFILISAFASEQVVTQAVDQGLFALLHKPVPIERMLEVVVRALERNVVMLVDDAYPEVLALADELREVGVRVETCHDLERALGVVAHNRVDVCVLDVARRPLEGLASCEALLRAEPELDIIALTSPGEPEQVRAVVQRGAACLSKPVQTRELLTSIARMRAAPRVRK